jgi:succinate dehydrogenase / fumarate reductase flavoprotein subunit
MRQVDAGRVKLHTRVEMLDVVVKEGRAVGVVVRDLITGEVRSHSAHAVVLGTGGYSNAYYLSTNAMASNATAIWRAHRRGAAFANPNFTQIHPTCIPASDEFQSKLTLMSESLRNDGRIWVSKTAGDERGANEIPEEERDYYLERIYPAFGNLVPRDVASRAAKRMVDSEKGVGALRNGVYLDFKHSIERLGRHVIEQRYGNLFEMYNRITDEDPYEVPMRIYPAPHYTMGGLWVDYNLMTTIPGLYSIGEANFSDHGANRLGASALMQGLADGYFVLPATINDYLADWLNTEPVSTDDPAFKEVQDEVTERFDRYLSTNGTRSVDWFHKELGKIMLEHVGMARNAAGLQKAMAEIPALHEEYKADVRVLGSGDTLNQSLERAGRVDDFFELAQAMAIDALNREESCGGHFREEHQTEEGEAVRDDENFANVSVWEWTGDPGNPELTVEPIEFENVELTTRSYK